MFVNLFKDIFQSTIIKYASSSNLKTELKKIRSTSKEADLFVRKYYEEEETASDDFEMDIAKRVELAAEYVASRLYEKGRKNSTDTKLLEEALFFVGKRKTKVNPSESGMNTIASLRGKIQNLYDLRVRYNNSIKSSEFQGFLKGLSEILKK